MLKRCFPRKGLAGIRAFLLARKRQHFTLCYHTHNSQNSQKGFPDLTLVHPDRPHVMFVELKDDKNYPTDEQRLWAAALMSTSDEYPDAVSYYQWRPKHYFKAVEILGGLDPLKHL